MTIRGRTRYVEVEPCSVGTDVIAEFLERVGWAMSAELVRTLGDRDAELHREAMRWKDAYTQMLARLEQYEPTPPQPQRVSYKPDWTCDG